jgi:IS30 family transposase
MKNITMQKPSYHRLRKEDRNIIYRMRKAGNNQQDIAYALGVSQSAVSKELSRNCGKRGYRPRQAHNKALERQATKKKRDCIIVDDLEDEVCRRLRLKHSPEQISLRLHSEGLSVSHETIYKYICRDKAKGGDLYKELRINGKRRYRRRVKGKRSKIPNRCSIDERPLAADLRIRYGDWEADLIEGTKGSGFILTLYERKTHFGMLHKLQNKTSKETARAIINQLKYYKVKTITYDNGLEFAGHEEITKALGAKGYFCQPYHSWEKGGVENFNGLVRQYLSKGTSFTHLTTKTMNKIENEINQRPRKTLNIKSPSELEHKIAA